jgi:hypothetical protein
VELQAMTSNLWEYIDPEERPLRNRRNQVSRGLERESSPPLTRSSQAPSASATPAPELVTNEQAQSVEDLTAEARYQYGLMWSIFQHDAKQHEIQREAVKEFKTWILKTVRKLHPHVLPPQEELQT